MTRAEWAKRRGRSSSVIRRSLRFAIYARDGFDCVYCRGVEPLRLDGAGLTLDHVVPRKKGGKSTAANMVTACSRCNAAKGAKRWRPGDHVHPLTSCARKRTLERVRRQLCKPINRELGLWLSRFVAAHRDVKLTALRETVFGGASQPGKTAALYGGLRGGGKDVSIIASSGLDDDESRGRYLNLYGGP